jgi:glycosyltransferase involved in cell wall biosynthesis
MGTDSDEGQKFPCVSVITVVYNAESVVEETIKSVLGQTYPAVEYVVVDGDSADDTWQIIQEYGDRIDTAVSEPDDGTYDAMNKGAELATGEWVIYMNAGDRFASREALFSVSDALTGGADVILAGVEEVLVDEYETRRFRKMPGSGRDLWRYMPTSHQSILVRRKHVLEYPFDTEYRWCADQDQLLRLWADDMQFESVDTVLSVFDCHDTPNRSETLYIQERWEVSRGHASLWKRWIQFGREYIHSRLWGPLASRIRELLPASWILYLRRLRGTAGAGQ